MVNPESTSSLPLGEGLRLSQETMLVSLGAAIVAFLVVYVLIARPRAIFKSKGHSVGHRAIAAFCALIAASFILIVPIIFVLNDGLAVVSIPMTVFRVLQEVVADNGFVDYIGSGNVPMGLVAQVYYVAIEVCYIALPILTVLNVYEALTQHLDRIRLWRFAVIRARGKDVFLFSDLNRDTLALAQSILDDSPDPKRALIAFSSVSKTESSAWSTEIRSIESPRVVFFSGSYGDVCGRVCDLSASLLPGRRSRRAPGYRSLRAFAFSDDCTRNVNDTISLLRILKGERSMQDGERCSAFLRPRRDSGRHGAGRKVEGGGADSRLPEELRGKAHLFCRINSRDDEMAIDASNGRFESDVRVRGRAMRSFRLPVTAFREKTMVAYWLFFEAPLYEVLCDCPNSAGQPCQEGPGDRMTEDLAKAAQPMTGTVAPQRAEKVAPQKAEKAAPQKAGTVAQRRAGMSSPLKPPLRTDLHVLVIGDGSQAEQIVRTCCWLGQMHGVRLVITVGAPRAEALGRHMQLECPGLADRFSIGTPDDDAVASFLDVDTDSMELARLLERFKAEKSNLYLVTALEDDESNCRTALYARRYFLEGDPDKDGDNVKYSPFIACLVEDFAYGSFMGQDLDLTKGKHGIFSYGNHKDVYSYERIVESPLDAMAAKANELYGAIWAGFDALGDGTAMAFSGESLPIGAIRDVVASVLASDGGDGLDADPTEVSTLVTTEHLSNVALALHTMYKSWALGYEPGMPTDVQLELLGTVEHDRWEMFYLSEGWTYLTEDDQLYYARSLHDNALRKIASIRKHVSICPYEEVYETYRHAVEGFRYPSEPAHDAASSTDPMTREVTVTLCLRSSEVSPERRSEREVQVGDAAEYQLLGSSYAALGSVVLPMADDPMGNRVEHVLRLPRRDLDLVVHPSRAFPGRQCTPDVRFEVPADATSVRVDVTMGRTMVNPVVYDIAFVAATPFLAGRAALLPKEGDESA